jgi:hypothetical protein
MVVPIASNPELPRGLQQWSLNHLFNILGYQRSVNP